MQGDLLMFELVNLMVFVPLFTAQKKKHGLDQMLIGRCIVHYGNDVFFNLHIVSRSRAVRTFNSYQRFLEIKPSC